jgi:hypothetical protein
MGARGQAPDAGQGLGRDSGCGVHREVDRDQPRPLEAFGTEQAASNLYVMWAYTAYVHEEFERGRQFLRQAMELTPAYFLDGEPSAFVVAWTFWIAAGTADYSRGHGDVLRSVFEQLPAELAHLRTHQAWADAQCDLARALRSLIWGRLDDAEAGLASAFRKGARCDRAILDMMSDELLSYESELGVLAARVVLDNLVSLGKTLNVPDQARRLTGCYAHNRALRSYRSGRFERVPSDVARAIRADSRYLLDRGMMSVLVRSLVAWARGAGRPVG